VNERHHDLHDLPIPGAQPPLEDREQKSAYPF
jgi:hypothetical protein